MTMMNTMTTMMTITMMATTNMVTMMVMMIIRIRWWECDDNHDNDDNGDKDDYDDDNDEDDDYDDDDKLRGEIKEKIGNQKVARGGMMKDERWKNLTYTAHRNAKILPPHLYTPHLPHTTNSKGK